MAERGRRPPRVAGHGRRPVDERPAEVSPVAAEPLALKPAAAETVAHPAPVAASVPVPDPEAVSDPKVAPDPAPLPDPVPVLDPEPVPAAGVTSPPLESGSEPWAGVTQRPGSPGGGRRRPDPWVAALVVLGLVAVVLGGVDLVRRYALTGGAASLNSAPSKAAVTAALNAAGPLTSYDYATTAATKLAAARPLVTAGCATSYQKDLTTLAGTLDPLKVVETVSFSAGGVQSTGSGGVTVLVFGERTAKDSRSSTPQVSQLQVALTMVHQGGRWLVDGVVSNGSGGSGKPTC